MVARRVGIASGAFVIAWFAAMFVGEWLFGSANFLVWVIAAVVGAGVLPRTPAARPGRLAAESTQWRRRARVKIGARPAIVR